MPENTDWTSILSQLNIEDYFSTQGIVFGKLSKRGWYVDCPFCGSKEKLSISKKGTWGCFKCGKKGNAITLYAGLNSCSNGDAVKAIKEHLGIVDDYGDYRSNVVPLKAVKKDVLINSAPPLEDGGGPSEELGSDGGPDENGSGQASAGSTAREAVRPRDIYAHLVRVTALSDAHRQELRTKRGLQDAIIDRLAFRSGGEYMVSVIETMRETFSDADLLAAGLLHEVNGVMAYNRQLLEDRVLIPYLDEHGAVYHVRPHKLGFKDVDAQLYSPYLLRDKPHEIVLTEGEFKAAALLQLGIPAIGIPGTSSFSDKNYDRLLELLDQFEVQKVTIIFDNEVKDDPSLPSYKEKPEKRYDTQYWTYVMAWKLANDKTRRTFVTRIGKLPDEWREKHTGKIDFDTALATGKTREDMLKVIDEAVTPREYLNSLDGEEKRIVQRKVTTHFKKLPVKREFNKYVVTRSAGKNEDAWVQTISNFVINIRSSFVTPEGIVRNVQFVNEHGEKTDTFPLEPGEMAGLNEWKKFCFGKGNFVFKGNGEDLINIWDLEFGRDTGDLVYMPEQIGRVKKDLWLFGNVAIRDRKIIYPDEEGIFWIDGAGYKPQSLDIDADESSTSLIASLNMKDVDIGQIAERMKHCIGGYEAYIAIGWALATIFSDDIFKAYKCFPFIFPHGVKGSGKTSLLRWIMAFFGIETEGFSLPGSSPVHITRQLSYFSSLGIWFDEFRNDKNVMDKNGHLRSAYNRQSVGKGIKKAFGTRGYKVRGTLTISGEELPKDAGLFSRCIPLQISAHKRNRQYYDWLQKNYPTFSGFTRELVLNYAELLPKVLGAIEELKAALVVRNIPDRTAENWAICAATFETLVVKDDGFIRWVEKQCQQWKLIEEDENALNIFFDDLNVMLAKKELDDTFIVSNMDEQGRRVLYLWYNGLYNAWATEYRKKTGREAFDKATILKYLQDEPYYLEYSRNKINFKGTRRAAHVIDVGQGTLTIKEIAETAHDVYGNYPSEQTSILSEQ